jgi:hypothetical protein
MPAGKPFTLKVPYYDREGVGGRYDLCKPCWDDIEHSVAKYGLGGPEPFRPAL